MAAGMSRKISAASARAHTRRPKQSTPFQLPSGLFKKILVAFFMGLLAWAYKAIQPPPPRICGSADGPLVTAPRVKLSDGRHLSYKEHGVPKDEAKHKIIYVHGFGSCKHEAVIATRLSPDVVEGLGVYIVSFDRPGYGESDPDPKRTLKSMATDIEELADQLGLGSKFYVVGFSMGGQVIWTCLEYIPHRLAGATLIAPAVNFFWPGFPANLSEGAYNQQLPQDQWVYRIAHYTPWLTYWWNTQKWFPSCSVLAQSPAVLSRQDLELAPRIKAAKAPEAQVKPQGDFESVHRDLIIGLGNWDFVPLDLSNPFPNKEAPVYLWQGDEDLLVPVTMQRYIAQRLPWIKYHELSGSGHMFPYADGVVDAMVKELLQGQNSAP